jgi:hypothetical protein
MPVNYAQSRLAHASTIRGFVMRSRTDLIEYLCAQQHAAYEEAALLEGWETNRASRSPWAQVPEENKATMRASMQVVLAELEDLGLLVSARVPA